MSEFYMIFARKILFPNLGGGQFPAVKLRVSGLDPDTNYIGIPIPGSRIPGSRTIFPIPNPGIGDALIPGFRYYEKRTKYPNFT